MAIRPLGMALLALAFHLGAMSPAAEPIASPRSASGGPDGSRLYHKPGMIFFWALNDACSDAKIDEMIDAFAKGNVAAVCLHARPGLLKPYGGEAWFEFIRGVVDRCAARNLDVWLYDEDPAPSGNCGGWITLEHPEYRAMQIKRFEPQPAIESKGLYCFPSGTLLWCGLVDEQSGQTTDLTARVGLVRRKWSKLDPWDSRFYYPATPLHACPRAWTHGLEYGVEVAEIPPGFKLLAFVASPTGEEEGKAWGEPDRLDPEVTRLFLKRTHERYAAVVGDKFGKQVRAIFSDEPHYSSALPWTREMFPAFRKQFGYDLAPRLWQLFVKTADERSTLTRLHFRQWCGDRFRTAWLEPVSEWCQAHHLALAGHISPEDDPVQQVTTVSNLFPLFPCFGVPGFDLIIPAVGDHNHPLINLGVLSASSVSQQWDRPGVLSESLGCSGLNFTAADAGRILRWQLLMGVTTHVIHCAYNSVEGLRLIEAPPDFGPESSRWEGMVQLNRELAQLQPIVRDARQTAPVAIVWPIRSFSALPLDSSPAAFTADCPLRNELVGLIQSCLDRQVGLHLIDEADVWRASIEQRQLRLGKAAYSHVVIPACIVLDQRTFAKLRQASQAGVAVLHAGGLPKWQQTGTGLEPAPLDSRPAMPPAEAVKTLPRLIELDQDGTDIRCTAWQHGGPPTRLLMNLGNERRTVSFGGKQMTLTPGEIYVLEPDGG